MPVTRRRRAVLLVVSALVIASCDSDAPSPTTDDASPVASTETTPDTSAPTSTENSVASSVVNSTSTLEETTAPSTVPTSALDDALDWYLSVLNGAEPSADEYEQRFGSDFRSQVSFDDFGALTQQLRTGGSGWTVTETERRDDRSGVFVVAAQGGDPSLRMTIDVDPQAGTIESLFLQPTDPPSLDDPPESFDEAVTRLEQAGRTGVLVTDVSGGACTPIDQVGDDAVVPIGSVFKLYVLGAVAAAIDADTLAWDDELVFMPRVASLPSGITQDEEPGTTLTVRELAGRMIAISDNTATDMLIAAVGREAVGDIQAEMGHTDPGLNQPFLTTRELFIIKLDPELLDRYASADEEARTELLDEIEARPLPELQPGDFTSDPVRPIDVEWFATPSDMCRALVYLADLSTTAGFEPIRDVMTASPGVPNDALDEIWFKGGSEPGLLAVAWLVRDGDRTFAVTGAVVDSERPLDETDVVLTLAAIRDLTSTTS